MGRYRHDAFVRRAPVGHKPRLDLTPSEVKKLSFERFFDFLRASDDARLLKDIMAGGSRG